VILGGLIIGFLFLGCGHDGEHESELEEVELLNVLPDDFLTPETVWNLILNESEKPAQQETKPAAEKEHNEHSDVPNVANTQSLDLYSIVFSAVEVVLQEKNPGILKSPQMKVSFPRGGGQLDLKQYLTGRTGTFFVKFVPVSLQGSTSEEVLFWSRAKKRRIDGEIHGSGCNRVLKMGPQWKKNQSERGIEVNTHRERFLSVLGGRYFFVSRKDKEIFLSQIFITHSDHKDLFCDDPRTTL
jgi:hypothetical protein